MAMTFVLPSGLTNIYNDMADASLAFWSKNIILVYPPANTKCPNCITNTFNTISTNRYNGTGPQPFTFGNCPYCEGVGYTPVEQSETIKMIVYNNLKNFLNIGATLNIPAGSIQTKCSATLYPKLRQCSEIRYSEDITNYGVSRYNLLSDIVFYGLNNRYILAMWKPFRGA